MLTRAFVFAAGRGERLRPLTDEVPKALVDVRGKALIEWQLERLAAAGITDVIVNLAWHGDRIRDRLGDGSALGVAIRYSDEDEALETAGGIVHARGLIGDGPFIAVNADLWTDYPFDRLALPENRLAHLVLVPNPEHNPRGDFLLDGTLVRPAATQGAGPTLTFAGIAAYHPRLFRDLVPGKRALGPLLMDAAGRGAVSGERYDGTWIDVGTAERLAQARG